MAKYWLVRYQAIRLHGNWSTTLARVTSYDLKFHGLLKPKNSWIGLYRNSWIFLDLGLCMDRIGSVLIFLVKLFYNMIGGLFISAKRVGVSKGYEHIRVNIIYQISSFTVFSFSSSGRTYMLPEILASSRTSSKFFCRTAWQLCCTGRCGEEPNQHPTRSSGKA